MSGHFTLRERTRSVDHAVRGIALMLRSQHNAWIHLLATMIVIAAGFAFGIGRSEWLWIVLAIVAVWTAEGLNTAVERLADFTSPEFHPLVRQAKDVAAGAVLIAALGAIVIGVLVFAPHVAALLR